MTKENRRIIKSKRKKMSRKKMSRRKKMSKGKKLSRRKKMSRRKTSKRRKKSRTNKKRISKKQQGAGLINKIKEDKLKKRFNKLLDDCKECLGNVTKDVFDWSTETFLKKFSKRDGCLFCGQGDTLELFLDMKKHVGNRGTPLEKYVKYMKLLNKFTPPKYDDNPAFKPSSSQDHIAESTDISDAAHDPFGVPGSGDAPPNAVYKDSDRKLITETALPVQYRHLATLKRPPNRKLTSPINVLEDVEIMPIMSKLDSPKVLKEQG